MLHFCPNGFVPDRRHKELPPPVTPAAMGSWGKALQQTVIDVGGSY